VYAVYFVDGGSVELEISATSRSLTMRWLGINGSRWKELHSIKVGQRVKLAAPGKGHQAAVTQ